MNLWQDDSMSKDNPVYYEICVKGELERRWNTMFEKLTICIEENRRTCLSGPVKDQAELYGLLRKVHDLGMTLISVNRIEQVKE